VLCDSRRSGIGKVDVGESYCCYVWLGHVCCVIPEGKILEDIGPKKRVV